METGNVARPAAVAAQTALTRADRLVSLNKIKTELPQAQAVTGVPETAPSRFEASNEAQNQAKREAALNDVIQRNISIDPKTREVIYQAVNTKTGDIIKQLPSESILRLRAYYREMVADRTSQTSQKKTEPQIPDLPTSQRVERIA